MADLSLDDIFGGTGSMTGQIIQNQKDIAEMKPIVNIAYTPNNKPSPADLNVYSKQETYTKTEVDQLGRIRILDIRDTNKTPGEYPGHMLSTFFNTSSVTEALPTVDKWYSGLNVRGWATGYASWQLASSSNGGSSDNKLYLRTSKSDSEWNAWGRIYSTLDKPTAADVGAVSKAGDTMTGALRTTFTGNAIETIGGFIRSNAANIMSMDGKTYSFVTSYWDAHLCQNAYWDGTWKKYNNDEKSGVIAIINGELLLRKSDATSPDVNQYTYKVYHEGNKPTSTDVGAIPANTKFYSNAPLLTRTADYVNDASLRNLEYAGFYRTNAIELDSKPLPPLMIHCPHSASIAHSRGIGFGYGVTWGTYTYRFDDSGVYQGQSKIYHEQDKPTAAELGVVNKAGDTMTGNLTAPEFHCTRAYSDDWFRAKGPTGLYFEDHGGGLHMTDGVWVKVFNNRKFHVPNGEGDCINAGGGIYAGGNGNFNDVYIRSDKRLKSNIKLTSHNLDKILKLKPVVYDKKRTLDSTETEREIGLIAQDVESIESLAVGTGADELKALKPYALISMLVGAVQEQQKQINKLTKLIEMRK